MSSKKKNAAAEHKPVENDFEGWGYETAMNLNTNSPMAGVFDGPGMSAYGGTAALSQPWELAYNNSYYFVSLNRVMCTYAYTMHGVIRTLVDQPVYDAFRGGIEIKSDELSEDDVQSLVKAMKELKVIRAVTDALRWDRLYGGAGIIINTNQNYGTALRTSSIKQDSMLEFIPADRWELVGQTLDDSGLPGWMAKMPRFDYYGRKLDPSRVIRVVGEEAPSLARRRLQGWGMSVIECVLREINSYLKNQNVLFELLDEAKIDVYKLQDFNSKVLSKLAQGKVVKRITMMNMLKNFANAIVLDAEDDYEQKQLSLEGVATTLVQIRIGIAAAVRMPLTKLFGLSASGFSSGEEDTENYNTIVEHERERAREVLDVVLPIVCRRQFGFEPQLEYTFKPLRVLSAIDEQNVRSSKLANHTTLFSIGYYTDQEFDRALHEDRIVGQRTEVGKGLRAIEPPMAPNSTWQNPQQPVTPKKVKEDS